MHKLSSLLVHGTDISIESLSNCKYCGEEFALYSLEKQIYDKSGLKYSKICSNCIFKLLYSFFNDRHLYNRKDSHTGNNIISVLSNDYSGKVIEGNLYREMLVDDLGLTYGKDIGNDIFDDFLNLYKDFPKTSRLIFRGVENSDYSSHIGTSKNLYLSYCVFSNCEDVYYSLKITESQNIFDSYAIADSSNVYSSHTIGNSHDVVFSKNSVNCSGLLFCSDMNNCKECIFCCNQVNKSYMIYNKQYTKEEYETIKKGIYEKISDYKQFLFLKQKFEEFLDANLIDGSININNCQKVNGESTFYSNNCTNVYNGNGLSNCINIVVGGDFADDKGDSIINSVEFGTNCENSIGCFSFGYNIYNLNFSGFIADSSDIDYCIDMEGCKNCMFCIGLRNKNYCILNKQYEKEEYFKKREEIIKDLKNKGRWGEYLPWQSSPYPYNDTLSFDLFRLNKVINNDGSEKIIDKDAVGIVKVLGDDFISDAILDLGGAEKIKIKWRTKNKEINIPTNLDSIKAVDLPNSLEDINEDILKKVIICEETNRPFRIVKKEYEYLKKKGFPLPRIHHENRIDKILGDRPKGQMHIGICDNCNKESLTVFKTKPKYKVFCPACYKQFMYG